MKHFTSIFTANCFEGDSEVAQDVRHGVSLSRFLRDVIILEDCESPIAGDFREGLYARTLSRGIRRSVSAAVLVREY